MSAQPDIKPRRKRELMADDRTPACFAELYIRCHGIDTQRRPVLARWLGEWYRYSDGHYKVDTNIDRSIFHLLNNTEVRVQGKDGPRTEPVLANLKNVAETRAAVAAMVPEIVGDQPRWVTGYGPAGLLACPNGLLNMRTGEFLLPTPAYFTTCVAGAPWDPKAPAPTEWLAFLDKLWPDDAETIRSLQQMMGYILSDDTDQQKLFMLVGPARSGKGTIARVCRALIGPDAVANPTIGSLGEQFGLSPLLGKKAAIVGDARLGGRADITAIMERLLSLSGEDALTINRKYFTPVSVRPGVRVVLVSNELPRFKDASSALASRFIILPTTNSFLGREDLGLEAKLLAELPGILRWAVEGYYDLRKVGRFLQPASGLQSVGDMKRFGSPVSAFVEECCVQKQGVSVKSSDLFLRWSRWCEEHGQSPGNAAKFGIDLRASIPGVRLYRPRQNGLQITHYQGIGLVDESGHRDE